MIDNRPRFAAPKAMLDRKPKHGQPCNDCGLCCVATLCALGKRLFSREHGPCPALIKTDKDKYGCGVVHYTGIYAKPVFPDVKLDERSLASLKHAALMLIFAGKGCDARFNGELADQKFYQKMEAYDKRNARALAEARKLWGINQNTAR